MGAQRDPVMTIPQIIVSLLPDGQMCVELPGPSASRRKVELREGEVEQTLRRILEHQMLGEVEIGLDGAPTGAQVLHWERHGIRPGPGCRFCMAEGRFASNGSTRTSRTILKRSDGVEVRHIAAKVSGLKKAKAPKVVVVVEAKSKRTAEEMGL